MKEKDENDGYIPVEQLNTRVELYHKPTLKERIQAMKDRARPHVAKAKAHLQYIKDKRASMQELQQRNQRTTPSGQRQQAKAQVQKALTNKAPDRLNPFTNPQVGGLQDNPRGSGGVMAQGRGYSPFMQETKQRDNGLLTIGQNSRGGVFAGTIKEKQVQKQKRSRTIVIKL